MNSHEKTAIWLATKHDFHTFVRDINVALKTKKPTRIFSSFILICFMDIGYKHVFVSYYGGLGLLLFYFDRFYHFI